MKRMLRFETYKLFKQKSFYICTLVCTALVIISALTTNTLVREGVLEVSGWSFAASVIDNAQLMLMTPICTALFVCDDFDQNTMKNIVAKGYGRNLVFVGKYLSSLLSLFVMYMISVLISVAIGANLWGAGDGGVYLRAIAAQFVTLMSYHALFFSAAMILGKTGGSIAAAIILPMLASLLFTLGDSFLKLEKIKLADFYLDAFMKTASDTASSPTKIVSAVAFSIVYIIVFLAVGFKLNSKREF